MIVEEQDEPSVQAVQPTQAVQPAQAVQSVQPAQSVLSEQPVQSERGDQGDQTKQSVLSDVAKHSGNVTASETYDVTLVSRTLDIHGEGCINNDHNINSSMETHAPDSPAETNSRLVWKGWKC